MHDEAARCRRREGRQGRESSARGKGDGGRCLMLRANDGQACAAEAYRGRRGDKGQVGQHVPLAVPWRTRAGNCTRLLSVGKSEAGFSSVNRLWGMGPADVGCSL